MNPNTPKFDIGAAILVESWILLILATTLVVIRCYGHLYLTKNWRWDDTSAIIALIFVLIGAILATLLVQNGVGKHAANLANPKMSSLAVLKYNTFFQMNTVICTFVTKVSIAIYVLRIKNDKKLRTVFQVSMAFMFLATLAVVIVVSLTCIPLEKLWTPSISGRCLPRSTAYRVAYVQSGFAIVTDLFLTLTPVIVLWNVRIEKGRKIRICFLMSLGLTATVLCAIRNYLQPELTEDDFTYNMAPITAVVILEQSLGVIAACIPACTPFIRLQKAHSSWYLLSSRSRTKSGHEEPVTDVISLRRDWV